MRIIGSMTVKVDGGGHGVKRNFLLAKFLTSGHVHNAHAQNDILQIH